MNYRHGFHAGNFADLVKHACLTLLLHKTAVGDEPLMVIETHAGAGSYELAGEMASSTGEAERGIVRLMAASGAPAAFEPLKAAVRRANAGLEVVTYPGSPLLVAQALRAQDRYVACELREDDHAHLKRLLLKRPNAKAVLGDGYEELPERLQRGTRTLVLIDPPFERGDDYERAARAVRDALRIESRTVLAVWLPIKDLETFDAFVREVEAVQPPGGLVAEARLRPLDDPMAFNGCAMVVINAPAGLAAEMEAVCRWIAQALGEPGGEGRVWALAEPPPPEPPQAPVRTRGARKPGPSGPRKRSAGGPSRSGRPRAGS